MDGEAAQDQQELYNQLAYYTLAHGDRRFIHQHVVDAFAVQNADANTKPIAGAFGLFGLFLHIERGYSGRDVQRAHMRLAKRRKQWPRFELPRDRGDVSAAEVLAAQPGPERDEAIESWCRSVWQACAAIQQQVRNLFDDVLPGDRKEL